MSKLPSENAAESGPVVYVVATPIGNLEDLSTRARRILAGADIIAAEDTRQTQKLLSHLDIRGKRLISYQDHGEAQRAESLLARITEERLSLALVSDAGTPCISDPGYRLVAAAKAAGVPVHPIPGPSALTALASASGLPTSRLLFVGFLPPKAVAMASEIRSWAAARASVVFFESTRRLARTLEQVAAIHPRARVSVGRELTKLFEEIVTLDIAEAIVWVSSHATLKGEAVVMVQLPDGDPEAGATDDLASSLIDEARREFAKGASLKDLLVKFKDRGLKRPALYQLLLDAKDADGS